jgi:hypothetical protein
VKEEPTDRSYAEPLAIANISTPATSQDTQNGKRKITRGRADHARERERERERREGEGEGEGGSYESLDFYRRTKIRAVTNLPHKRAHVAPFHPIEHPINNRGYEGTAVH